MTTGRLQDKVVILTGGTSGIGRAAVKLFCQHGAKVVIGARNEAAGAEIVQEVKENGVGEAFFVKTDVSVPEQVENLVEQTVSRYGRVDVLFGNSGILPMSTAPDTSIETWRRCIDVNLGGNFYLAKYGIPAVIESGGNTILFTSSELGTVGASEMVAYCASKGGVVNMTRAMAIDHGKHGIRVNCVCPGDIDTPMLRREAHQLGIDEEEFMKEAADRPLSRVGKPQDVAYAVLYFASDISSWVTGSILVVDGGGIA